MFVKTIHFPRSCLGKKKVISTLTCDKLGSLLEMGENEVGNYVEACKQEDTDLQGTKKNKLFTLLCVQLKVMDRKGRKGHVCLITAHCMKEAQPLRVLYRSTDDATLCEQRCSSSNILLFSCG